MTDLLVALKRHGYRAVERERARRGGADDFTTSLLGRRTLVVRSDQGARAFYDEELVRRADAVPVPLASLLFGHGAVHGLDGVHHDERKRLFLGVLDEERTGAVVERAGALLTQQARAWPAGGVTVFDELVEAYGAAVIEWAGLEATPGESRWLARELARIVAGFGGEVPAYPRAWVARRRTDSFLEQRVSEVRQGSRTAPHGSVLARLAAAPLQEPVAAVELGNVLRPTVAVAWLACNGVLQMSRRPPWRPRLATDHVTRDHRVLAQEVRRFTPFVPLLAGRMLRESDVAGFHVRAGDRLVLDVRGINTDPGRWADPEAFVPERFESWSPGAYDMVPQGGGDLRGHRCPGESLTVRLLAETLRVLAPTRFRIDGAAGLDLNRIPALPTGGLALAPHVPPIPSAGSS